MLCGRHKFRQLYCWHSGFFCGLSLSLSFELLTISFHLSLSLFRARSCEKEGRLTLASQKAKLRSIMEGVRARYTEVPMEISNQIQEVTCTLQEMEQKVTFSTGRWDKENHSLSRFQRSGACLDAVTTPESEGWDGKQVEETWTENGDRCWRALHWTKNNQTSSHSVSPSASHTPSLKNQHCKRSACDTHPRDLPLSLSFSSELLLSDFVGSGALISEREREGGWGWLEAR